MKKSYNQSDSRLPLAALEHRLEREAPSTIADLRSSVSFDKVWEQEKVMKPDPAKTRSTKSRAYAWVKVAAAAVIAAGVAAGVNDYLNREVAAPAPQLNGISKTDLTYQPNMGIAWNRGYEQIEKRNLSTPLNLTLEDQGVKLTLLDVFYDGSEARINYIAENKTSDPALNEQNASFNYTLTVDGAGEYDITEPSRSKTFIDDHRFAGVVSFEFQQDYHPAETTAKLNVTRLATRDGSWQADIPLTNEKSEAATRTLRPETEFKLSGRKYVVEKVVAGPVSTWLTVTEPGKTGTEPQLELNLQLYDDKGNWLVSKMPQFGQYEPLVSLNNQPEYLTLQVTRFEKAIAGETRMAEASWNGKFPVVLRGYGEDKLTVTGIDFLKDRTVLKYEVNNPELQGAVPMLTDTKGQSYLSASMAYRTSADKWTFETEFSPIDPADLQKISSVVTENTAQERAEKTVTIPLDWSKSETGTR